ncbi:MAG TPA: dihydrolipoyl dehydrogenase [Gemmataceae bacterium]|nr:dihydrolipoyl dehydrogenase [Gemmataceae bacterium]
MADNVETDLLVLGGGPGGYAAAFLAADRGLKVTMVDATAKPGGVCLHCGCIPSKALLHAARIITETRDAASWGLKFAPPQIDLNTLRARKDKIIDTLASHLLKLCKDRQVTWINSRGTFEDANTLALASGGKVRFKNAIIATGSSPTKIPVFDIPSPRVMDSTAALKLESTPATLLVIGGGYIGLEMGTVYAAIGSKVTVVELTGSLLPGVDPELVRPLAARLQNQFQKIHLNTKVTKLEEVSNGIRVLMDGQDMNEPPTTYERVLVAVGRRPNSLNLGLEKIGVQYDSKSKFITVDEHRRTSVPHIYAIGDVAGEPMLAHKATHEGKLAVQVILGEAAVWDPRCIPAVVFTDPEIAWAGLMENEAKRLKREVSVARFSWAASGRAMTLGRTDGITKLIVDPETDRLLGVGLCGPGAGELIAEGVVAIEMGATSRDVALSIHPHPTLTETISEAAETLHGLSSHIYKVRRQK